MQRPVGELPPRWTLEGEFHAKCATRMFLRSIGAPRIEQQTSGVKHSDSTLRVGVQPRKDAEHGSGPGGSARDWSAGASAAFSNAKPCSNAMRRRAGLPSGLPH